MTNADFMRSRPELTAGAVIAEAEAWYERTHVKADRESASLIGKLTEWLTAEHTEAAEPEATLVTTLELTHVLRGTEADDVLQRGTAQRVADTMLQKIEKGLRLTCKPFLLPDNMCISRVQVFGMERSAGAAGAGPSAQDAQSAGGKA